MNKILLDNVSFLHTSTATSVEKSVSSKQVRDISTLGISVKQALHEHLGSSVQRILFQNNVDKYYNAHNPLQADHDLHTVFDIMRSLNQQAIDSPTLGATDANPETFTSALMKTLETVISHADGRPLQYIELGPEPTKTAFILRHLQKAGVQVQSYTGVDINPASEPEMRSALTEILAPSSIQYAVTDFAEFRVDTIREKNTQVLATMMGFQEGNEDPKTMSGWLSSMLNAGDLLLSEVQLYQGVDGTKITDFYQHPLMQTFSTIAFQRALGDRPSMYETYLLPVRLQDGKQVMTMILCEAFEEENATKSLLVTNYCLKFSDKEFHQYREYDNTFKVKRESHTGDKSIVFQLSQRT